ncbi:hypothetical protein ACF0H5_003673 [Mactra antiquata]
MWNIVYAALRSYAPIVVLPVAITVGFIGYNVEGWVSDKQTEGRTMTFAEERDERKLMELKGEANPDNDNRYSKSLPSTVLNRNTLREGTWDNKVKKD